MATACLVALTGVFATSGQANFTTLEEQQRNIPIEISSSQTIVEKSELIKRFKELFPGKFDYLNNSDFYMHNGYRYYDDEDETIRYSLSFHKEVKGQMISGDIGFIGEDLKVEHFYYSPGNEAEASFPPKVSEEEAQKIAKEFLTNLNVDDNYRLDDTYQDYYYDSDINRPLTEPVRYNFSFVKEKDGVAISDQRIQVTILGNGEVTQFHTQQPPKKQTFDKLDNIVEKAEISKKFKENLSIDLQYQVEYEPYSGEAYANLVYVPFNTISGIHAENQKWLTYNGFKDVFPKQTDIKMLADKPVDLSNKGEFTVEKAREIAEDILATNSNDIKLRIESVDLREDHLGREVISVHYMYEYRNGGYGTTLEFNKETGDMINYHNILRSVMNDLEGNKNIANNYSYQQALTKATEYVKKYVPSYLHYYSMPVNEQAYYNNYNGEYQFTFPRVKDGIIVMGDQISVGVSAEDGSFTSINVNHFELDTWPSVDDVLSEEDALEMFSTNLDTSLRYERGIQNEDEHHYFSIYLPVFNEKEMNFLNAITGEWRSEQEKEEPIFLSHPWAEKEINYLLNSKILKVDDITTFDANEKISKGKALEVMIKSLTRMYPDYYRGDTENINHTFENIEPDHPLFQVVEQAVNMGILDKEKTTFPEEEMLTREELAVWYIRALGLEEAAKRNHIFKVPFKDSSQITDQYRGYVVLAEELGLLTTSNDRFNPTQKITYAQIAVSSFRFARKASEQRPYHRYYY